MKSAPADTTISDPGAFGPLWLLGLLARGRRPLLILPLLVALVAYGVMRWRMVYSADATFRPGSATSSSTRLNGLAAQLGFALPGAAAGDPVRFYARVLSTRDVLAPVVTSTYRAAHSAGSADSMSGSFLDLYHITGSSPADRLRRGIDRLRQLMAIASDPLSGLITIRVTTRWPELSLALMQQMLVSLDSSNVFRQQASAKAEREFVEKRLSQARSELEAAESAVARFLVRNRQYQNSPALTLEYGGLQRRVDLRQQVFVSLAQSYEQARIDEVRNTPSVSVVDHAEGSVREAGRPVRDAAVWLVVTAGIVMLVLAAQDVLRRYLLEHPDAASALRAELGQRRSPP